MKAGTQNHLKVKRLMRLLGVPMYRAVGVLESIWLLCSDCCDEGDIGKYTDDEIADYIGWDGPQTASELVRTLADSGWLDPDEGCRFMVHDWLDHAPEYIQERIRKRHARASKQRKQTTYAPRNPDTSGTFSDKPGQPRDQPPLVPSIPNPTQPNPTNSNPTKPSPPEGEGGGLESLTDEFVSAWNATPGVVRCRELTTKRAKSLRTRLRDPAWKWRDALKKFPLRCFAGEPDSWKPDIEWFLGADAVTKVLEGKYDWEKKNAGQRQLAIGDGQRHASESAKPNGVL